MIKSQTLANNIKNIKINRFILSDINIDILQIYG